MVSREARIGFIVGALTGAGALCILASSQRAPDILGSVERTTGLVEKRAQSLDQLLGQLTDVASNTTRRFDAVAEVVEKNLLASIMELGGFFGGLKHELSRSFPNRVA